MRIIGKISVSLTTVISGSCIYTFFNHREHWNSTVQNYIPSPGQLEFPSVIPTGSRCLGLLIAKFPEKILDLSQSDHFYIRNLVQEILASADYPQDFDFKNVIQERPSSTLTSLARIPHIDERYFDVGNQVLLKGEDEKLKDAFHELLSSLPTTGQDKCTQWFTKSAFRGGKSGSLLYKSIFWGGEDDHGLSSVSPDVAVPLFLKALRKHSEVPVHRPVIVENRGLELLQVVAESYSDVKTIRFLSQILGNLALDEESHKAIITKGWIRHLRQWVNSKDIVIKSHSSRALANLDRDGERGFVYGDGIFVLYPTKQLKCCKPEVDLVFIHGLGGSPFRTWRSGENDIVGEIRTDCWPADWLPIDVPSCRIILVEYNSELSDWTSKCSLQPEVSSIEHRSSELMRKLADAGVGKRSVFWISHSMGGLLVKQLLVDSAKNCEFRSLNTNTKGVIFYAVPHKGSDVASLVSGKARYVFRPSFEVKELQRGSEMLENLHQDFLEYIQEGHINVLSYGETEPSRIVRDTLVVPRESADFGIGEFVQLPVNHYKVCKPHSHSDPCYLRTVSFIKEHMANSEIEDNVSILLS